MKKTVGIFAHVDAGKTTFTEQLLYHAGSIQSLGRVHEGTSAMDTNEMERRRGITIFADQGYFTFKGDEYFIVDTPGHVDFSAEAERTMEILDFAVLLVSAKEGIQAHTVTLFELLKRYHVPTIFFINKMDMEGAFLETVIKEMEQKLTRDSVLFEPDFFEGALIAEFCAERNEAFMDAYLESSYTKEDVRESFMTLFKTREAFPVFSGSAVKGEGIKELLDGFFVHIKTSYEDRTDNPLKAVVYKLRHDEKGNSITYMKILEGRLFLKEEFLFEKNGDCTAEKINEIRFYNGARWHMAAEAKAGDVVGVTGLSLPVCGTVLYRDKPVQILKKPYFLTSAVYSGIIIEDDTDKSRMLSLLKILEKEEPGLKISFQKTEGIFLVHVMGKIQLEVLEQEIYNRFGVKISFQKPQIEYKETITDSVIGYGHFEPLRHYAEVKLRLEPAKRGSGITFASECPVDWLSVNYQHLIAAHVFEREHKGILTGSPVTDLKIVLLNGRAHIKHTEGGDFREALYRAVRQGLEKAHNRILEPFYRLDFFVAEEFVGRILSDLQKFRGSFEAPETVSGGYRIKGRGPVAEFMDYPLQLAAFTKGRGNLNLIPDGYDFCENEAEVIERIAYQKERDTENTSTSVFCAKGAAFTVPWDKAEEYMHTNS